MTYITFSFDTEDYVNSVGADDILRISALLKKHNINPTIINCSSLKPLDVETIKANLNGIKHIFTLEDGVKHGGLYSQILEDFKDEVKVDGYGYPDKFIEHGSIKELEALCKLDAESIANDILNTLKQVDSNESTFIYTCILKLFHMVHITIML